MSERADVFARINYKTNEEVDAFVMGYKYAHLEMKEEMKKFTQGFSYKNNLPIDLKTIKNESII